MTSLSKFQETLQFDQPPEGFSVQLKSLWHDGKGDWQKAHDQVDRLNDRASAWIHAYLHRKEGDVGNADYWYSKAGQTRPKISLEEEWGCLVTQFGR